MTKKILPTPEQLRELLTYDPETGKLFWKERPVEMFSATPNRSQEHAAAQWNSRCAGKEAFTASEGRGYPYKIGGIFGKIYKAHRVIWAIYHGHWPEEFIDHINMDTTDNRIVNLRAATRSENGRNRDAQKNSTSGAKGIYWHKPSGRWMARARLEGKTYYMGFHITKEQAMEAYKVGIDKVHGEFARPANLSADLDDAASHNNQRG